MKHTMDDFTPNILVSKLTDTQGTFSISPLAPGFGTTLGSALRRTLFSSQTGYAISHIKVHPSVAHEFASIKGVKEDLQDIILNLKQIRLKKTSDKEETKILIPIKNKTTFKGSDISKAAASFEVMNPQTVICHMEKDVNFDIELTISQGRGYESAEEHKPEEQVYGSFPIDTIYAPIKNVVTNIENMLVGKRTDYEKLIIDITTDGTKSPKQALKNAATLLTTLFGTIAKNDMETSTATEKTDQDPAKNKTRIQELLETPLTDLKLTARVVNSLGAHGIECLKDLVGKKVPDLLLYPNFGKKCLQDLQDFLKKNDISWDNDIAQS